MSKKKLFFLLILLLFNIYQVEAKQLTNNVLVSIDNSIITELDVNKEINFLKFIKQRSNYKYFRTIKKRNY